MFSSDLSDEELRLRLSHLGCVAPADGEATKDKSVIESGSGTRILFVFSGKDEYVPEWVDLELLSRRLVSAANGEDHVEKRTQKENIGKETEEVRTASSPGRRPRPVARLILPEAQHAVADSESIRILIEAVVALLSF